MSRDIRSAARPVVAFGLLTLLAASGAMAASIEAEIDRNETTLEDRLVLTLTVTGSGSSLSCISGGLPDTVDGCNGRWRKRQLA